MKIGAGKLAYVTPPTAQVGAVEALICCAVPASALVSVIC